MNEKLPLGIKYKNTPDSDIAISSRVRLARNIAGFPFPVKSSEPDRLKIADAVAAAAKKDGGYNFKIFPSKDFSAQELYALAEKRLVSAEFINSALNGGHCLLIADREKGLYIMVNEEDHLRIQALECGNSADAAYQTADLCDSFLEQSLNYAYDENLGYLTECPTNLGTGMRASVMLHLPALAAQNKIRALSANLIKLGLVLRGFYGEGSDGGGNIYQISNQITLGVTEKQTLDKLNNIAAQIAALERTERHSIYKSAENRFKDRIFRSYGIFKNAYIISVQEFLNLWSDIRFGISLGIITDLSYAAADKLLTDLMPANLTLLYNANPETDHDILRAQTTRGLLINN